jgi:hypothetical protein
MKTEKQIEEMVKWILREDEDETKRKEELED